MSRINHNIASLQGINRLKINQADLAWRLQRLSTGLRINTGKDAPAGLIASENLRSEIAGINQAIDNSNRATNVLNTAEGALGEVAALLLEVQSLTSQAANTGALSKEEVSANQLQVDSILNSINRSANTTQFNGVKLLNGSLDYTTSGANAANFANAHINAALLPDNAAVNVVIAVTQSAQAGTIGYWVGQPHAHRGYMTAALRVLLPSLFGELNLHRIEAACIPSNAASIRVLEKCGFTREGLARRYLCINGVWQDHLLFGLLHEDFRG